MEVWQWAALGVVVLAAILVLLSEGSLRRQMIEAVNARLPEAERFGPAPSNWRRTRRQIHAYRRLYPDGDLVNGQILREVILLALFLTGARLVGLPWFVIACGVAGGVWMWWMLYRR